MISAKRKEFESSCKSQKPSSQTPTDRDIKGQIKHIKTLH